MKVIIYLYNLPTKINDLTKKRWIYQIKIDFCVVFYYNYFCLGKFWKNIEIINVIWFLVMIKALICLGLISTYDVLKLRSILFTSRSVICLISTYDVLKCVDLDIFNWFDICLISTYDVLKYRLLHSMNLNI